MLKSSSMSGDIYNQERNDGSQSDTALGTVGGGSKKRRSSLSARVVAIVGNRRSRSTSQISGPGQFGVCVARSVHVDFNKTRFIQGLILEACGMGKTDSATEPSQDPHNPNQNSKPTCCILRLLQTVLPFVGHSFNME